jgi:hypothetical protein
MLLNKIINNKWLDDNINTFEKNLLKNSIKIEHTNTKLEQYKHISLRYEQIC